MEQELIEKSLQGDYMSFEQLINQHQRVLYNLAYRTLGHEVPAKEAAQIALVKSFKNLSSYTGKAPFSYWLAHLVVTTCHEYLESERRHFDDLQ